MNGVIFFLLGYFLVGMAHIVYPSTPSTRFTRFGWGDVVADVDFVSLGHVDCFSNMCYVKSCTTNVPMNGGKSVGLTGRVFFFLNESDARKQQLKFLEICIFLDMVWRHQQSLYRL